MATHDLDNTGANMPLVLKVHEVARLLNVSERTVWRLTSTGEFPAPIQLGRSRRWSRKAIVDFLDEKVEQLVA